MRRRRGDLQPMVKAANTTDCERPPMTTSSTTALTPPNALKTAADDRLPTPAEALTKANGQRFSLAELVALVKQAANAWVDDKAATMGAALSYYSVFSLAPLLLIVVSVAGLVFGADAARGEIVGQLRGMLGDEGAKTVEALLASVNKPAEGIGGSVVGIVLMLVGATTVFAELQDALDRIWRAPVRQLNSLWAWLRARIVSFGLILGIGFLLMVSLVFSAGLNAAQTWWRPYIDGATGGWAPALLVVNAAVGLLLTSAMFAMIYKIVPRARIAWRDVAVGAVVTAVLFQVGQFLIGMYIGRSGVSSGFGAAGSLAVILVWVYYSAQIFLFGAEFTWVFARRYGSHQAQRDRRSADSVADSVAGQPIDAAQAVSSTDATLVKAEAAEPVESAVNNAGGLHPAAKLGLLVLALLIGRRLSS